MSTVGTALEGMGGCPCGDHIYDPAELDAKRAAIAGAADGPKSATDDSGFVADITVHPAIAPLVDEMRRLREHFHAHPELAFQEVETAAFIAARLRALHGGVIAVAEGIAKTGVVGWINGTGAPTDRFERFCVLLRADMDALPLQELDTERNAGYKSVNENKMHACGHDGHMAMLLTAADVIASPAYRATIPSNLCVKFVFQPAEESGGGAKHMVDAGILEDSDVTGPYVDEVYGIHLWAIAPLGQVWTRNGSLMAASDRLDITVLGSGGHGAMPQGTKDAVVIGAQLVTALQSIVARNVSPLDSAVVTIGAFKAGYSYNIIADKAELLGTVRSLNRDTQKLLEKRIREVCRGVAIAHGCEIEVKYSYGYPATVNGPPACVERVARCARTVVGSQPRAVLTDAQPTMGAEDFAFMLGQRSGAFLFVAAALDASDLQRYPHHKSTFDFDPAALPVGASIFLRIVESFYN